MSNGLCHWLIAGFRYAAQEAAMREGHLWDITPRVASGEHGRKLPFAASRLDVTTDQESLGSQLDSLAREGKLPSVPVLQRAASGGL
jgi:hypothetical protein